MNEVRILARQTFIYGFGTIVPRFLNYGILTFLYTRLFDKGEYGVVTELYGWMVFLLIILTYGMETGFFRYAQKEEDYEKVYSTSMISLLFSSALFLILVNLFIAPVASALKYEDNPGYIRLFAAIVATDAFMAIPFARLRRENKALLFSVLKIFNVLITVAAVLFLFVIAPGLYEKDSRLVSSFYNPAYGVGYVFVANLIGSVSTLIVLLPYTFRVKLLFDRHLWFRMISYSLPLMIAGLGGAVNETLDKVIMRRVAGEETGLEMVGEYGAGYKIAVLMSLFIQMFRFAAEPFFFERAKREGAKATYAYVMKYFILAMLLVYLVINLYINGFKYIIGESFRESVKVVPVVGMGYLLYGIYVNHSIWYKLNDLTRFGIYITFSGALVTVLINVFLIPSYGYMASAWAHVASYGVMIILSFIMAEKRYKIDYGMIKMLPYFVIAVMIVVFVNFARYNNTAVELLINTMLLVSFILFAQYRDKLLTVIFGKENVENQNNK
ncbi:MAG: oligosaccharide flippase family protein [Bacteroidales bacterium]|nr:oligosaccharide flippase family protein [Bacteroidales bacterium]